LYKVTISIFDILGIPLGTGDGVALQRSISFRIERFWSHVQRYALTAVCNIIGVFGRIWDSIDV
jgi:hypothetical protein